MIVDAHHHWIPEEHFHTMERYMRPGEEVRRAGGTVTVLRDGLPVFPRIAPEIYQIDRQIELMDAAGIDVAILHTALWQEWNNVEICAFINDEIARAVRTHPTRLVGLAHVPVGEGGAIEELERAVTQLGLRGVAVNSHLHALRLPLDARQLWPFWRTVAELDVPVVVHPSSTPLEYTMLKDYDLHRTLGRLQDMAAAALRLVFSGLLDEFPTLRFIMGHMGGGFFAVQDRVIGVYDFHSHNPRTSARERLANLYVDTAPPFWTRAPMQCAIDTIGASNILLGSDFPIGLSWLTDVVKMIQDMDIDRGAKTQIMGDNAARLFKLAP